MGVGVYICGCVCVYVRVCVCIYIGVYTITIASLLFSYFVLFGACQEWYRHKQRWIPWTTQGAVSSRDLLLPQLSTNNVDLLCAI